MSNGRNSRKKPSPRGSAPPALVLPAQCDCPACTGEDIDPEQLLEDVLTGVDDLAASTDPLEAEVAAASLLAIGATAGDEFEEALISGFIPRFEARANAGAAAMLQAVGAVAGERVAEAASAAADRQAAAGAPRPSWAQELAEPVTVADCSRLSDAAGTVSLLTCSFHRAGRSHAVIVGVDDLECSAAQEILLLDAGQLPEALAVIGSDAGVEFTQEPLEPVEFRWQVERALDARAVHDGDQRTALMEDPAAEDENEEGLDYPTMSVLLRARLATLPTPTKPAAVHPAHDPQRASTELLGNIRRSGPAPELPPAPARSGDHAPIYQVKVGLRGAKPPIWRRLEVPADVSLAELHEVIQVAFDWDDSHLHVFETPYGRFGTPDVELGHRPEWDVTLEQVAPEAGSTFTYRYDFGDDWEHEILVEKALDGDPAASYPRCTGGRRAAPPEDCGGVWGYAALLDVLNDPTDPEHEERLEWLGLDRADEFDPARFDPAEVTRDLSVLR